MTNRNCANELPGPKDVQDVQHPVTDQNAQDGFDHLAYLKVIALLLSNQDHNNDCVLDDMRICDLGRLIFFLTEHPSSVLSEVGSHIKDPSDNLRVVPLAEGRAA